MEKKSFKMLEIFIKFSVSAIFNTLLEFWAIVRNWKVKSKRNQVRIFKVLFNKTILILIQVFFLTNKQK